MHLEIDPERVYEETELRKRGGLFRDSTLRRARKEKRLRYSEPERGRRVYLGRWILAWLTKSRKKGGGQ